MGLGVGAGDLGLGVGAGDLRRCLVFMVDCVYCWGDALQWLVLLSWLVGVVFTVGFDGFLV